MTQAAVMPEWMEERLAGATQEPGEIDLTPDEAEAFTLFAMMGTQWRMHPMAGRIGLDYAALPHTATMAGIAMTPRLFADVRTMEAEAMAAFSEGNRA